jgi:hypothetical protein
MSNHFYIDQQRVRNSSIDWEWVGEWLLFNANSAIFQLCRGENKLIFNEMIMESALF